MSFLLSLRFAVPFDHGQSLWFGLLALSNENSRDVRGAVATNRDSNHPGKKGPNRKGERTILKELGKACQVCHSFIL